MRDSDEAIERLMAGLRDAEPSPGMKRRIFEAMEAHQTSPLGSDRHRLRPSVAAPLLGAAALAASLIVATRVHQPAHMPAVKHSVPADVGQGTQPEALGRKASIGTRRTAARVSARRPHDLRAGREMQSSSYPAPPLPLTEQEKMLLRVAHHGDEQNKALLNPELQAAQSAKSTEQFQHFFEINAEEMRSQSE